MRVGINGFGRIGRDVARILLEEKSDNLELVAINASGDLNTIAHIFRNDSLYGRLNVECKAVEGGFIMDNKLVKNTQFRDPAQIPWKDMGVDIVIDATGAFKNNESLYKHINEGGAKKVILTAPAKGEIDKTIVMGVNDSEYDSEKHHCISNASCTTNCLAPLTKVIEDNFGIKRGLMTTIHAYTSDQVLLDEKHKDIRRARAAALSMVPTTTGAAKAVSLVIPSLEGKLTGYAVRVPVPTVSLTDVVFELNKDVSKEEINEAVKKASENELKGILGYAEEELVSCDYMRDERSSIFDPYLTLVIDKNLVKLVSWYDNEWGYSRRVVDLAEMIARKNK